MVYAHDTLGFKEEQIWAKRVMTKIEQKLIKSKARVKEHAEVFTPDFIVKDMCDLIPDDVWEKIDSTFLEPACGTGNFLVEILARKYKRCKGVKDGLKALSSIVGVDIQQYNVEECKARLMAQFLEAFPEAQDNPTVILLATGILDNNIICDNTLDPQTPRLKSMGFTAIPNAKKIRKR